MNDQKNEELYKVRHSLAHILAQAVKKLRPGTKLGFGPAIDNGFYYDFILPSPITEEDFPAIEKEMKRIIKSNQKFEFEDKPNEEALSQIRGMGEPYKEEYAKELIEKNNLKELRFYKNGDFIDMCEGPHVDNSNKIPKGCFKIRSVAGAYWRGDSDKTMMTRIYAWAFESKEKLEEFIKAYKESLENDHKKLGKELDLFHIDPEIGKGLPLWLPNGTVIREELEKYVKELEFRAGFKRVATPHITKQELYHKTGHLPYYKEGIFPVMEFDDSENGEGTKEAYCLKPMNCPHHHKIFAARMRSYKDLPLRLAEYGQVYRYEDAGSLSGLLRVRGMAMNDGHIYCTEEQIEEEFLAVMEMHKELYKTLGIENYYMRFSTYDPDDPKGKEKFVQNPEAWEKTQKMVYDAMVKSGLDFYEGKGEAAFYGPKIDFQFRTVTGREETASTNQLDFAVPERLDLKYIDSDNQEKRPYIIHRAPAGTHERFIAFLIEHFKGAFPTWLAPLQIKILPVTEAVHEYCKKLQEELLFDFVRVEIDDSKDSFGKKIRNNTKKKIPNLLIIGEQERDNETITLRRYGIKEQETMSFDDFKSWIKDQIGERRR